MNKILGIGVDVTKHSRMEKIIIATYAERFFSKVLHPLEI